MKWSQSLNRLNARTVGARGSGKSSAAVTPPGKHQVLVEADTQQVSTFGQSHPQTIAMGYRIKCGCGWGDYAGTQEEAHKLTNAHLDGKLDEEIAKLDEPVELTPRDREDARVRQGTIEKLLDG